MPASRTPFEETFLSLLEKELRRQGVLQPAALLTRIGNRLSVVETQDEGEVGGRFRSVFELDFSFWRAGDSTAISVLEVLLRMNGMFLSPHATPAAWHVILKDNLLTDRVVKHTVLLLQTSARLTYLDVSENQLSEAAASELQAVVESSAGLCELVLHSTDPQPRCDHRVAQPGAAPCEEGHNSPPPAAPSHGTIRASRRSLSSNTATSLTSRSTYAGGSADALRRRRAELFGRCASAEPLYRSASAAAPIPESNAQYVEAVAVPPSPAAAEPPLVSASATTPAVAATEGHRQSAARQHNGVRLQSTPPRHTRSLSQAAKQYSGKTHSSMWGATGAADGAAGGNEPYEPHDAVDVTANLNPIVDSVLNLKGLVDDSGRLRQPSIFGGAENIWDLVWAYEAAVEQSLHSGEVDAETAARVPSALLGGGAYNAVTVLCLSSNHLTELQALPATLLRLDISSNRLTRLEGLKQCRMLTVLNARRNRIEAISGLEGNPCLAHLFLGRNCIKEVVGLAHLLLLETLDLSYNRLRSQASIRALSLCSGLRHLLLRGNPLLEEIKGNGHRPLLRNLCPTLLMLDDERLAPSRTADAIPQAMFRKRQSQLVGGPVRPIAPPDSKESGRLPYPVVAAPADPQQQSGVNLLHMLTRGVTASTGYGDGAKAAQTVSAVAQREAQHAEKKRQDKARAVTAQGMSVRMELVKKLAEESKRYLASTIVARMTDLQQKQHRDGGPHGGALEDSPIADVMGYTAAPQQRVSAIDTLRPYASGKYGAPRRPKPARAACNSNRSVRQPSVKTTAANPPPSHLALRRGSELDATVEEMHVLISPSNTAPTATTTSSYAQMFAQQRADQKLHDDATIDCSPVRAPPHGDRSHTDTLGSISDNLQEPVELRPQQPTCGGAGVPAQRVVDAEERPNAQSNALTNRSPTVGHRTESPSRRSKVIVRRDASWQRVLQPPPTLDAIAHDSAPASLMAPDAAKTKKMCPPRQAPVASTHQSLQVGVARTGRAQQEEVQEWARALLRDSAAVQGALRTVVDLLRAQRQRGMATAETDRELPPTYLAERRQCAAIIQDSGILCDTDVPTGVMLFYGLRTEALENHRFRSRGRASSSKERADGRDAEAKERTEVLRQLQQLRDAKTCLRYMMLLMSEGREAPLQEYIDQVGESLSG